MKKACKCISKILEAKNKLTTLIGILFLAPVNFKVAILFLRGVEFSVNKLIAIGVLNLIGVTLVILPDKFKGGVSKDGLTLEYED